MLSLKHANTLLREGKHREALEIFSRLRKSQPGFTPYEQGYELASKLLGETTPSFVQAEGTYLSEAIHPQSEDIDPAKTGRLFAVVTPVLNGEKFLEASLNSVLNQAGDFFIDYFVKDAESTDNTLPILQDFLHRISSGNLPLRCNGIRMRIESGPDKGLYDAVAHGFSQRTATDDILAYINADDVFAEDAFRIAMHVFDTTPAQWLCGQPNVIDENDQLIVTPEFPLSFAREDIHDGLHDGKSLYFIQQEGSFWLRGLYDEVGGFNRSLKLAGDFDLWRRFSACSELLALNRPLASFRSHVAQLSRQIDKYYSELEQVRSGGVFSGVKNVKKQGSKTSRLQFFMEHKGKMPVSGLKQRPGPVCFLNEDGQVREIAYIKRGWATW